MTREDLEILDILGADAARLGDRFTECTGIDSATGKLLHYDSRDLSEGRIDYGDILAGKQVPTTAVPSHTQG